MIETKLPNKAAWRMKLNYRLWCWFDCYCRIVFEWDCVFFQASIAWLEAMLFVTPRMYEWCLEEFWQAVVSDNKYTQENYD